MSEPPLAFGWASDEAADRELAALREVAAAARAVVDAWNHNDPPERAASALLDALATLDREMRATAANRPRREGR